MYIVLFMTKLFSLFCFLYCRLSFMYVCGLCSFCVWTLVVWYGTDFNISFPNKSFVSTSLSNSGLCWTVFARNRDTAVPAEGNGDLQTLICVLVARSRRCPTLPNPVPWQNWMAAYLGYTLQMKTLFRGWPVMVHDTHTRRSGPIENNGYGME